MACWCLICISISLLQTLHIYIHTCCMIPYKFKGTGVLISCILAFCVGESCHYILYHDLAQLTIYGTTAKWPICISGHWYILNRAASASN